MSEDLVIRPGVGVRVGGDVQATGVVVEILEGRRVGGTGPIQVGRVRIQLDGNDGEVDVSADDIESLL